MKQLVLGIMTCLVATFASATDTRARQPVSVVLVHGAFEDSSTWTKVVALLQKDGVDVVAAQLSLASLESHRHTRYQ